MTKNKLRTIVLLLAGLLWAGMAQAQESVNATGGDAAGSGGFASYSVGQVVYTTNSGSSGSVAQGVQHAYEISIITATMETDLSISLSVFPNPTADHLTLQLSNYNSPNLSYQLFDMQGKLVRNEQLAAQQTTITMSYLPSATYFVHIINQENQLVQSFKIIKN